MKSSNVRIPNPMQRMRAEIGVTMVTAKSCFVFAVPLQKTPNRDVPRTHFVLHNWDLIGRCYGVGAAKMGLEMAPK